MVAYEALVGVGGRASGGGGRGAQRGQEGWVWGEAAGHRACPMIWDEVCRLGERWGKGRWAGVGRVGVGEEDGW